MLAICAKPSRRELATTKAFTPGGSIITRAPETKREASRAISCARLSLAPSFYASSESSFPKDLSTFLTMSSRTSILPNTFRKASLPVPLYWGDPPFPLSCASMVFSGSGLRGEARASLNLPCLGGSMELMLRGGVLSACS